jgi:PAS domain S-box-containing protein
MTQSQEGCPARSEDAVVVLDAGGRLSYWNAAAERLLRLAPGREAAEAADEVRRYCWASPEVERAAIAELTATGAWRGDTTQIRDGERLDIEVSVSRLAGADGDSLGMVVLFRDVTSRKQAEIARKEQFAELKLKLDRFEALARALPMCASCKRVQERGGAWQPVEEYFSRIADVTFCQGICPDCIQRMYPELYDHLTQAYSTSLGGGGEQSGNDGGAAA